MHLPSASGVIAKIDSNTCGAYNGLSIFSDSAEGAYGIMRRAVFILLLAACLFQGSEALGEADLHGWMHTRKYEYVNFGQYPQLSDGTILPVMWRVLDCENGQALLISEYVLDARQVIFESDPAIIADRSFRRISMFEESDLFPWVNSTMRDMLFTNMEQQAVIQTPRGQIFFLSRAEYLKPEYGFTASVYGIQKKRQCKPTQYALEQGVYQDKIGTSGYWTSTVRSPEGYQMQLVGYDGHLSYAGYARKDVGLRISCLIDLSQLEILSGKGIKGDPFQLSVIKP